MRSRAGSLDRKEGSHLQSLDPSRVALLESRSSTTITSAIVVGRLVPLELRRFSLGSGRGCFVEGEVAGAKSPDRLWVVFTNSASAFAARSQARTARRSIATRERDAASDRPTQSTKSVSG